jgi:hypothetical protein
VLECRQPIPEQSLVFLGKPRPGYEVFEAVTGVTPLIFPRRKGYYPGAMFCSGGGNRFKNPVQKYRESRELRFHRFHFRVLSGQRRPGLPCTQRHDTPHAS